MAFSRHIVQQLLADLEDHIDRENLRKLLHYSKRIAAFQSRARYVKSAIDELLDSGKYSSAFFRVTMPDFRLDEDLSAMYLTSRAQGRPRALHDHEQLELLLESFVKQVEEIVSEVDTTVVRPILPFLVSLPMKLTLSSLGQHAIDARNCRINARFRSERSPCPRHQDLNSNTRYRFRSSSSRFIRYERMFYSVDYRGCG